ncbi:MAG: EAL domain-containing protein [Parvibaculaceae bacterium]|nr:EAL domain-containing protein [Parvibaculaceae bacterium]
MRGPRHITVEAWILGIFVCGLVVMLMLFALSWYNSTQYTHAQERVVHLNEHILAMSSLLMALEQADGHQRGYLLLHEARYRDDCVRAIGDARQDYNRLQAIFADDRDSAGLVSRIGELEDRKIQELTVMLELVQAGNNQAAIVLLRAGAGRAEMDELRTLLSAMKVHRAQELEVLLQQSERRAGGSISLMIILSLGAIAGLVTAFVLMNRSLGARRRLNLELSKDKSRDELTGLPNKAMFMDWGYSALAGARREDVHMAMLYLDLDLLSEVNKLLGTRGGDAALVEAARRFQGAIRQTDMIARLGEDEFGILVSGASSVSNVATLARRLIDVMARPLLPELHEIHIGVSIGIAIFPDDGKDMRDLLANGRQSMLTAKSQGKNRYRFHFDNANQLVSRQETLSQDLFNAVANKELYLLYQPQIDLQTGEMVGAEALLRWRHPYFGDVGPQEFIPIAEASGSILTIGAWVLRTACEQMVRWQTELGFLRRISVNVSSRQLLDSRVSNALAEFLSESGIPPDMIEIELVERMLVEPRAADEIDRLKAIGVRISIDDFGTGYSSLSYLKRFSIDMIKIDKSFVDGLPEDSSNASLTPTIIGMAQGMGIEVIAEGVETPAQAGFLLSHGCRLAQGYLFAKPMSSGQLIDWVQTRGLTGWK